MLFLDYDGTLTPIAQTPQQALIPKVTKRLLDRLSGNPRCKLAIISGRSLRDIKKIVGLRNIIYSGNHGLEIEGPRLKFKVPVSPKNVSILEQIKKELAKSISSTNGVIIEDKGLSVALHYRLARKREIPDIKIAFHKSIIPYFVKGEIMVKSGKKVLEARLPVAWDKGKVVLWLMARQKFSSPKKGIIPVYFGDDKTDEDAFLALRHKGLTVFVGRPVNTYAQYYVKDYRDVTEFLRRLCQNL